MKSFFVLLLFFLTSVNVLAQCCSAGNPVGGDGTNDGLGKNELRLFLFYKHSHSKDYFHLDKKIEVPTIENSFYDFANLSITYGLINRLSVHSEIGYFFNKTQNISLKHDKTAIKASGIGDLSINLRGLVLKTVKPVSQLVLSGGIKLPVGAFHEELDGITIPISLQPSSGALKYNAGVFLSKKNSTKKIGISCYNIFEISQTIKKEFLEYRYGNYFQFSVAGTYSLKSVDLVVNAKFEWRGKDRRENGVIVESSGSKVVFINPQMIINLKGKWGILAMADVPVYKYVNGYQLTNLFSVQIGIRRNFSFCKSID